MGAGFSRPRDGPPEQGDGVVYDVAVFDGPRVQLTPLDPTAAAVLPEGWTVPCVEHLGGSRRHRHRHHRPGGGGGALPAEYRRLGAVQLGSHGTVHVLERHQGTKRFVQAALVARDGDAAEGAVRALRSVLPSDDATDAARLPHPRGTAAVAAEGSASDRDDDDDAVRAVVERLRRSPGQDLSVEDVKAVQAASLGRLLAATMKPEPSVSAATAVDSLVGELGMCLLRDPQMARDPCPLYGPAFHARRARDMQDALRRRTEPVAYCWSHCVLVYRLVLHGEPETRLRLLWLLGREGVGELLASLDRALCGGAPQPASAAAVRRDGWSALRTLLYDEPHWRAREDRRGDYDAWWREVFRQRCRSTLEGDPTAVTPDAPPPNVDSAVPVGVPPWAPPGSLPFGGLPITEASGLEHLPLDVLIHHGLWEPELLVCREVDARLTALTAVGGDEAVVLNALRLVENGAGADALAEPDKADWQAILGSPRRRTQMLWMLCRVPWLETVTMARRVYRTIAPETWMALRRSWYTRSSGPDGVRPAALQVRDEVWGDAARDAGLHHWHASLREHWNQGGVLQDIKNALERG